MKKQLSVFEKIECIPFIAAIRSGLLMVIPVLMTGAFALILKSLPISIYIDFIKSFCGGIIYSIFNFTYNVTFGLLSVFMSLSVGYCFAKQSKYQVKNVFGAPVAALGAFMISVGFLTDAFEVASLSAIGMFTAIVCSVIGSTLYCWLSNILKSIEVFSDGADPAFNRALSAIFPTFIVLVFFALINFLIYLTSGVESFYHLIVYAFVNLFKNIGSNFSGGLLYVVMSSVLWFFGIHGSDVLESVNQHIFIPASTANAAAAAAGNVPVNIYTKTFFDVFVLMGGCGCLLCLLCAMLIFSRRKSNRSLAKIAVFPMLFNINEIMVFGLPIIYNPIMFIPFICAPLSAFLISSASMKLGLVPLTTTAVEWTTPIILGGYQSTGAISGALLQIVNLTVGTMIYMPFVRMYDHEKAHQAKKNIGALIDVLQESEEHNRLVSLTGLDGITGDIAKQLVVDLERAIAGNELYIMYQPQCDNNGEILGAEALLRWNHKHFGMIYPPLIIKLAAESNQLTELEKYVFRAVKRDVSNIIEKTIISVNATSTSMRNKDFITFITDEFPNATSGNAKICIEITEQSELITDDSMISSLRMLRAAGFRLAIDDFSMGHTSLKYLRESEFDVVKLDGSLTKGLMGDSHTKDIIASIVFLSRSIGFTVLAEYVESEEQKKLLEELGCTKYQGYLYSPPITIEDFKNKLKPGFSNSKM